MYTVIAKPLEFFYELWPNYAGAIALLTITIMVLLLPLTLKGTRSMLAMQKLQPELKKLQNKHRDDRQKLNEEVMKFYKENNINPMSGCLPLLLQMPVFFVLYRTLYQLLNRAPYGYDMGAAVGRAAGGKVYEQFGYFRPKHLDLSSALYKDLSHTNEMRSFGINLAESAQKAFGHGLGSALPFIVLVLAVTATSYYQQRQIAGRNPQAAAANPQQAMLMKIMPLFFAFISLTLPAGIVVYFLVSNLFRIGQQEFITRTMYRDGGGALETTGRESADADAEPPKGIFAQLKEASRPNPAQAREQARQAKEAKGKTASATKSPKASAAAPARSSAKGSGAGARPSREAPSAANRSKSKKKRK